MKRYKVTFLIAGFWYLAKIFEATNVERAIAMARMEFFVRFKTEDAGNVVKVEEM